MNGLFYFLSLTLYSGIFVLLYRLLLSGVPAHAFNRRFLLAALLLPLLLPLVRLPAPIFAGVLPDIQVFTLNGIIIGQSQKANSVIQVMDWNSILPALYLSVAALILGLTVIRHLRLSRILHRAARIVHEGAAVSILPGYGPGSYYGRIFFSTAAINPLVLAHEKAHVAHRHHYDLLLIQLVKALCWANPFIYYLSARLKLVHEYEADSAVASISSHAYTEALLQQVFQSTQFSIAHSFSHHPIKNRIIMLQKQQFPDAGRLKALAIGAALCLTAGGIVAQTKKPLKIKSAHATYKYDKAKGAYRTVSVMPAFKSDVSNWLSSHLKYPEAARSQGAQGRVVVEFIVTKNGAVTQPKVVRSSGKADLDAEALRVIGGMPAWKPGRQNDLPVAVYFSLPITFQLEG